MNIQILDSWIREFLETKASATDIARCLSLCGPSVEKLTKINNDYLYDIEVTTNRVDLMSVYGIAREASAILPRFGFKTKLLKITFDKPEKVKNSLPLSVKVDNKLVRRTLGVVIDDIKNWESPNWMKKRLEASGVRSLNSIVDITNYVMLETGHPMHAFDYEKIPNSTIIVRESKRGEKITTLDDKEYILQGGDIVFESINGEIIDLPGIMGTKNTSISSSTRKVLLFVDNNDPVRIRRTSMSLAIRTQAATLNEKNVDPELGMLAILRAIKLAKEVAKAKVVSNIYDNYPIKQKRKTINLKLPFITKLLGVEVEKDLITSILSSLGFEIKWNKESLSISIPSFRAFDIEIAEDIVEEIARIYGYHNLPSKLMSGALPEAIDDSPFSFEEKIKSEIASLGGVEVYTLSLVSQNMLVKRGLKLKNPLGPDSEYLRTSLRPSLIKASLENSSIEEKFHIFELANVYIPRTNDLPNEVSTLGGIFRGYSFREAKGVIEALLDSLNIDYLFKEEDGEGFIASGKAVITSKNTKIGEIGIITNENFIYYEFEVEKLKKLSKSHKAFVPIPKYPPQIEDITLKLPERIRVIDIICSIKSLNKNIKRVELKDVYSDSFTFRIWYQNPQKTLTDQEVGKIRKDILLNLGEKFGVICK